MSLGVASSGIMQAYIERFHDPAKTDYLHPIDSLLRILDIHKLTLEEFFKGL